MQVKNAIMEIAEEKIQQAIQEINSGKAEEAMQTFVQVQLVCIKYNEAAAFRQITGVLNSVYEQVGEAVYAHLTQAPIQEIVQHGIVWNGQTVVSAQEAETILEKLNTIVAE